MFQKGDRWLWLYIVLKKFNYINIEDCCDSAWPGQQLHMGNSHTQNTPLTEKKEYTVVACCLGINFMDWTAAESFEGSHLSSRPWGTKSHSLSLFLTFNTRSHFEKLRDLNAKYRPTVGKFSVVVLCLSTCTYPWIYCMYMAVFYSAHYPYHK